MYDWKQREEMAKQWFSSLEFLQECQPFEERCEALEIYLQEYAGKLDSLKREAQANTHRIEYSKGGDVLPRGFYCPSPTIDLVVGGCKRGRILSRNSLKKSYEYWFDESNQLIGSVKYDQGQYLAPSFEMIVRRGNLEIGLEFGPIGDLNLQLCVYDGDRIMEYTSSLVSSSRTVYDLWLYERYEYVAGQLVQCDWYDYSRSSPNGTISRRHPMLRHNRYRFLHDEDGYINAYTMEELWGDMVMNPDPWVGIPLARRRV